MVWTASAPDGAAIAVHLAKMPPAPPNA